MRILISGGTGNLGQHFARHLTGSGEHRVRLLVHRRAVAADLKSPRLELVYGDLARADSLLGACEASDCIVHLAGVLFAPHPERFLPITNIEYVRNLMQAAVHANVSRFVLVSFPHVEGETSPEHPASSRLDRSPSVIHFRTRLEAERLVLQSASPQLKAAVVRAGVVYGPGVKLTEGARWLLKHRMMAIWRRPTWLHLIALPDLVCGLQAAAEKPGVSGIYNLCDDEPMLLETFLKRFADRIGVPGPWHLPAWCFGLAGVACENFANTFRTRAPITRDIIAAAMMSSVSNNSRRSELLPKLQYPSFRQGISLL